MRSTHPLAHLDATIAAFLAYYRCLGRRFAQAEWVLHSMRKCLADNHATDLDQRLFDLWRRSFAHLSAKSRYSYEAVVHQFCRYRRRTQPDCFLPDPTSFARPQPPPLPHLIEPVQIARMLSLTSTLKPTRGSPLRPTVMRVALVLLYTAGLRRGELLRLRLADVDLRSGVLRIQESKFHKSRWVPVSPSACKELRQYLRARQACRFDARPSAPLLCHRTRGLRPYSATALSRGLHALFAAAGVRTREGRLPRIHDLRHSFAAAALLRWYEAGASVQANLPKLAMYMGHVSIVSTAHYLRWIPAVMARASERFEDRCGVLIQAGEP